MNARLKVNIVTPARLHLGIIDTCSDLGRKYGSIGVTIDTPNVVLEATPSRALKATGVDTDRTLRIAQKFLEKFPKATKAEITVSRTIPEHVGLGSGTQLSLAIGTAISRLSGLELNAREIAFALGRGRVSGIGVSAFMKGGFILDAGRSNVTESQHTLSGVSLPVLQTRFPDEWRFVVAIPNAGKGLSGRVEQEAFSDLPPASPKLVGEICRLIIMKMLPSLIEKNVRNFGESMTAVQRLVGDSFSEVQGGRFLSPLVEDCIKFMLASGAFGAGQSSWGPTVYGIVDSDPSAAILEKRVDEFLKKRGGGMVLVTKANNVGAKITLSDQ